MSDKKSNHLSEETTSKLKTSLENTVTDAVELITEAYGQDLFSKQGRGDKVWLYKGAKEALSCAEKIKRILRDDELTEDTSKRGESAEAAAAKLLQSVQEKLEARKQRPS